jgi:hypothetical protein
MNSFTRYQVGRNEEVLKNLLLNTEYLYYCNRQGHHTIYCNCFGALIW